MCIRDRYNELYSAYINIGGIMKIAIVGAGAMGCLYGAKLSEVKSNQVFLIDVWQEHIDAINEDGLIMEENGNIKKYQTLIATNNSYSIGPVDLAIIFVKSTLTFEALDKNKSIFGPDTSAITLQNGLGNIDIISNAIGPKNVLAGTTAHGATMIGPGKMRHAGTGETIIGELTGETTDRIKNGRLMDYPEIEQLLELAVREAMKVAESKGIKLSFADPVEHTKNICKATAANKSSMLQDIMKGNKTEIEMINGAIVKEGKSLEIDTPVNLVLTNIIKFIQRDELQKENP